MRAASDPAKTHDRVAIAALAAGPEGRIVGRRTMSAPGHHAREIRPVAAALLMLGACGMFAFNSIFVKLAAETGLHPFQIAFFRNFFALMIIAPMVLVRTGPRAFIPNRPGMLALRGGLNGVSMMAWFYAVPFMAITDLTAIGFTGPIWATLMAAFFLGEKMRLRRWTAIAVGILGALVVVRPGFQEVNVAVYLVLLSSATWGATLIVIRRLTSVEHVDTILIYQAVAMAAIALVPMLFVWTNPTPMGWLWMAVLGLLAMGAHSLHVRAFAMQEVSALQPLDFARFPIAAVGAYLILGEMLSPWTAVGALIVFGAGAYISHREAQLKRREAAAQTATSALTTPIVADIEAGPHAGAAFKTTVAGRWGPGPSHLFHTAWATLAPGVRPRRRAPAAAAE